MLILMPGDGWKERILIATLLFEERSFASFAK